jgi:hypothetical protein
VRYWILSQGTEIVVCQPAALGRGVIEKIGRMRGAYRGGLGWPEEEMVGREEPKDSTTARNLFRVGAFAMCRIFQLRGNSIS